MKRAQNWPELLHAFIEGRKSEPFVWGENDCCLFSADAIWSMTGEDPAAEFRGKYVDEASAMAAIASACGGAGTEDGIVYVAEKHGWAPLDSVLFAQRGDLVALESGGVTAAGIVHLNGREALFVSTTGLHKIPLRSCKRAWRVG